MPSVKRGHVGHHHLFEPGAALEHPGPDGSAAPHDLLGIDLVDRKPAEQARDQAAEHRHLRSAAGQDDAR